MSIRVTAHARLHFGFLDLSEDRGGRTLADGCKGGDTGPSAARATRSTSSVKFTTPSPRRSRFLAVAAVANGRSTTAAPSSPIPIGAQCALPS